MQSRNLVPTKQRINFPGPDYGRMYRLVAVQTRGCA